MNAMNLVTTPVWEVSDAQSHARALEEVMDILPKLDNQQATREEIARFKIFSTLIQAYESAIAKPLHVSPAELIQAAMEESELEPKDLATLMGSEARVVAFLNGNSDLSIEEVVRLSKRFRIRIEALIGTAPASQ
jgi:HTH-type transcriptional regulator / antitoxin HigA